MNTNMTEYQELDENIQFVAQHFIEGTLLPYKGWQRFKLLHHISTYRRNIAAAGIAAVVLAASASIYYFTIHDGGATSESVTAKVDSNSTITKEAKTAKIQFNNAPLTDVVAEIERVYDVKITNLPEEEILITISYEGTASDLIETINELFNIKLTISPKEPQINQKE